MNVEIERNRTEQQIHISISNDGIPNSLTHKDNYFQTQKFLSFSHRNTDKLKESRIKINDGVLKKTTY